MVSADQENAVRALRCQALSDFLLSLFSEDDEEKTPAKLGTEN